MLEFNKFFPKKAYFVDTQIFKIIQITRNMIQNSKLMYHSFNNYIIVLFHY